MSHSFRSLYSVGIRRPGPRFPAPGSRLPVPGPRDYCRCSAMSPAIGILKRSPL
jgi:hypothetical protein